MNDRIFFLLILGVTLGSSCGRSSTEAPGAPERTIAAPLSSAGAQQDCVGLTETACRADTRCKAVEGMRHTAKESGWCLGRPEFAGCIPLPAGCGDGEVTACAPGSSQAYLFSETCLPAGWQSCAAPTTEANPCDGAQH